MATPILDHAPLRYGATDTARDCIMEAMPLANLTHRTFPVSPLQMVFHGCICYFLFVSPSPQESANFRDLRFVALWSGLRE